MYNTDQPVVHFLLMSVDSAEQKMVLGVTEVLLCQSIHASKVCHIFWTPAALAQVEQQHMTS